MGLWEAIGGGGLFAGDDIWFGEKKKTPDPKLLQPEWQTELEKSLSGAAEPGALERIGRAGEPYTGQMVAPLSQYESQGLGQLGDYLGGTPWTEAPLAEAGRGELMKTLEGNYNPMESEYWKAYREGVMDELSKAKTRMEGSLPEEAFYGGTRGKEIGKLETRATRGLTGELGRLFENERERRLSTVPAALGLARAGAQVPLERASAAQQYGALPRTLEQAELQADYQEFVRQLKDLGIPLKVAQQLIQKEHQYMQPSFYREPGLFDFARGVGDIASSAASIASLGA